MTQKSTFLELATSAGAAAGFVAAVMGLPITHIAAYTVVSGLLTAGVMTSTKRITRWMLLPPAAELIADKICPHCDAHGTITELHRTNVYIAVFCEACKSTFDIRNTESGVVALKTGTVNDQG
jgi:hypothetical protein